MRFFKYLKILLISLLVLVVLTLASLEILSRVYRDHAATYFREQFTQQSDLVLQPFETTISVWRHFPKVTFTFNQISVLDTSGQAPVQVLWVKRAAIAVPLNQLRPNQIKINRVELDEVLFYQRVDSSGQKVGLRFKPRENVDTTKSKLPFLIPQILIRQSRIVSQNQFKNSSFSLEIKQANLSARVKNQQLTLSGDLNGHIGEIKNNKITLFQNQPFRATAHYQFAFDQKSGTIYNTHALVNNQKITISGTHTKIADKPGANLNLTVAGQQPLTYLFKQLLPPQAQPFLARFKTQSHLYFKLQLSGHSGPTLKPRNRISFKLTNGAFYLPNSQKHIRNVQLAGEMTNGAERNLKTSQFVISHLSATTASGQMQVRLQVSDFTQPLFKAEGQGKIDLAELADFVNLPFTQIRAGVIAGDFKFSGQIPDTLAYTNSNWLGYGTLQLQQAAFRPLGLQVTCQNVNTLLKFSGNLLELQNLSGNLGGHPFRLEASIQNYFSYLFNEPGFIKAKTNIYIQHLDTKWLNGNLLAYQTPPGPATRKYVARPATNLSLPLVPVNLEANQKAKIKLIQNGAGPKTGKTKKPGQYRQNPWENTQTEVNLGVDNVSLPGGEKIKNLRVRINQLNQKVKLTRMRFTTTGGGQASADGGFNLVPAGISLPYLRVNLQYDRLNLQTFMQDLASLNTQDAPQGAAAAKAQAQRKEENLNTLKEKQYWLNLRVRARHLDYLYLKGTNFLLEASLNNNRAQLSRLSLQAFGGRISARGEMRLNGTDGSYPLRLRSQVKNINLQQVFAFAESMKLDVLSSKNIKGAADCNLMVNTHLDNTFSPHFVGTVAYAKASFRNMELIEVAPIQNALRFIRKERTGHLYFEDATTNFVMRDYQFITPGLKLNSNLMPFELSGSYTMGGPAQLNLDVNVLSVLFGNNKRRIARIKSDSLENQSGGRQQHFQLRRENTKYKVRLSDRKEQAQTRRNLNQQFLAFLRQHQIDTVFTMR